MIISESIVYDETPSKYLDGFDMIYTYRMMDKTLDKAYLGMDKFTFLKEMLKDWYGDKVDFTITDKQYKNSIIKFTLTKYIPLTIAIWLIPTAIVYVLGRSIGWIIKGFKS